MFKPTIHYSKARTQRLRLLTLLTALFVLVVLVGGVIAVYHEAKAEGAAQYKAKCISNYQNGYLTVRTQCQPGYRSK